MYVCIFKYNLFTSTNYINKNRIIYVHRVFFIDVSSKEKILTSLTTFNDQFLSLLNWVSRTRL